LCVGRIRERKWQRTAVALLPGPGGVAAALAAEAVTQVVASVVKGRGAGSTSLPLPHTPPAWSSAAGGSGGSGRDSGGLPPAEALAVVTPPPASPPAVTPTRLAAAAAVLLA